MYYKIKLLSFLFLLFAFTVYGQSEKGKIILNELQSISKTEILSFAEELSSDKYMGRLSGSPEYLNAAKWCAAKFREWNILPANNNSYFQYFPNAYTKVFSSGSLTYTFENKEIKYSFPDNYFPGSNSASGIVSGQMVYAGFGITAPELEYDDYENIDVKGKIVIIESGTPYTKNDAILAKWTPYAYHRYKMMNAVKQGAAGALYVGKLANPNTDHIQDFIYVHIDEEIAGELFSDSDKDYSEVKKQLTEMKPQSFTLNPLQKIRIEAETEHFPDTESCNVVGMIEGTDPVLKNEVIIVGGHLDGQGYLGEVFPSALDNASGVADIMGAAKAIAASEIKPKRSILFILFGGEECGLFGSTYYLDNPIFPPEKTTLMINLDMVGNGTGFYMVNGKSHPGLYKHFEQGNDKYIRREMNATEQRKNFGRPRTDGAVFENAGIKTFQLFTQNSVHPVYYHHPLDKTDVLTPDIMEDAAKLLYLSILGIANDTEL